MITLTFQELCMNLMNNIRRLPTNYLITLVLFFLPLYYLSEIRYNTRKLRKYIDQIPGPRKVPFFGNAFLFVSMSLSQLFKFGDQIIRKYSPILRIWIGPKAYVLVTKPEYAEIILHDSENIEKSDEYNLFLTKWLGNGLLTSKGNKWHTHRKLITPAFHFRILNDFFKVMVKNADLLVEKLRLKCDHQPFDIIPYISLCTLDIICETAMGVSIGAQKNKDIEYVKALHEVTGLATYAIFSPWLWFDFIFRRTNIGKRFYKSLNILHSFTRKVIQERKRLLAEKKSIRIPEEVHLGKKKDCAFLDSLLQISNEGLSLTDEEIREEVDTFMFEGHDTTTTSIGWILYLLGSHPEHQKKVIEELDAIFNGSDRPITMKDLNEMKYLERVIKEGLRLFPTVPIIGRVLTKDVEFDNYRVPRGVNVYIWMYLLHRCPEQFPNPENFDPDNFLPENITKRHPYSFLPFSAGSRNCIGQKFALMEEKTILAQLLRHFEIEAKEKLENLNLVCELVMHSEHGIVTSLKHRTTKE